MEREERDRKEGMMEMKDREGKEKEFGNGRCVGKGE